MILRNQVKSIHFNNQSIKSLIAKKKERIKRETNQQVPHIMSTITIKSIINPNQNLDQVEEEEKRTRNLAVNDIVRQMRHPTPHNTCLKKKEGVTLIQMPWITGETILCIGYLKMKMERT